MVLDSSLEAVAVAFVVLGILASIVSVGVLARLAVGHRRERQARQESIRTHRRRLVTTH
jgi:hypothetical protein